MNMVTVMATKRGWDSRACIMREVGDTFQVDANFFEKARPSWFERVVERVKQVKEFVPVTEDDAKADGDKPSSDASYA